MRMLAVAVLITVAHPLAAQSPVLRVRDFMTPEEARASGVAKLSEAELLALDAWFSRTSAQILRIATASQAPTTPASPLASPRRSSSGTTSGSSLTLEVLEGATIMADDGEFLGKITANDYDSQSILNDYGRFGGKYSSTSIFNDYGRYGGEFARMSPFNLSSSTPPRIFKGEKFLGFLTRNSSKTPSIDPYALVAMLKAR
jgi:hypothetical protein